MQLNVTDVKKMVAQIGFTPQDGKSNVYFKTYPAHDGYAISIDFNNAKIKYYSPDIPQNARIKLGDETTSNFSHLENFVVLECVDRLLRKGYAPSCIELEKTYPSGRGHSGKLDILVRNPENTPFLMIECKTWGTEYEKEHKKMLKDGGQLFSYYTNDRNARFLCLYTSRVGKKAMYKNAIVDVENTWHSLSGTKEIYEHWNKNSKDNGVFEDFSTPYDIKHKALTYGMLKNLKEEDGGKIYNQIMEILRHNAISDKPNAFNKLLNLFVCKIIDENKNENDELKFQWLETDTDESLQMRLNDLYKEGMWRFLEIRIIDYEEKEVSEKLKNIENDDIKQWVMQMYQDTRLKKSPNFAFVEVQDEKTFHYNAKVVREIVKLLQIYKFRYGQKHEFLGDFFELLLNTSMKQEAGQFFTPAPITRFIISSLPLQELVQKRVDERNADPLPAVIDYACGSGHFLTEYMSQLQKIIDNIINTDKALPTIRNQFESWKGLTKFLWAKDTVYGIDFDNRLVKTTKVNAFFNGDGEATIVWANGLDNFSKSDEYRGKLKQSSGIHNNYNGQFDILISNPPYSVEAFKSTIQHGTDSFELYKNLTDSSSEIECLFVERMKQLLRIGGWAGIILPSSILSNSGIHSKAREIILKYFKIISIVELGSGTFMETGTNTIILFLERRNDNDHVTITRAIDIFLSTKKDITVAGIENAFSKYVTTIYDNLLFEDYISFIGHSANANMQKHELYTDYNKLFGDNIYGKAVEIEKEKMLYFLLAYNQDIVLVKTGKKRAEKLFLGYEFSKRRGHEGMRWLPDGTKLYDEKGDLRNPKKANSYIYKSFFDEKVVVDESLARNVSYSSMSELIEFRTNKFDKVINLVKREKPVTKWPSVKFGSLLLDRVVCQDSGFTFPKNLQGNKNKNDIPFFKVSDMNLPQNTIKMSMSQNYISEKILKIKIKGYPFPQEATIFPKVGMAIYTNKKRILTIPAVCDNNVMAIWSINENILLNKYLFFYMDEYAVLEDYASSANPPSINQSRLAELTIPLPPIDIQYKIVGEVEKIIQESETIHSTIKECSRKNEKLFDSVSASSWEPLGQVVECNPPKSELSLVSDATQISFVEMASVSSEGYIEIAVDRPLSSVRKGSYTYFKENDIIIAKITPCMENGKCALATKLKNGIGMGSSEFHVFRCNDTLNPHYVFAFMNREIIRKEAELRMTGASGHRRVPISYYQHLSIPILSITKQGEIVRELKNNKETIRQLKKRLTDLKVLKKKALQKNL